MRTRKLAPLRVIRIVVSSGVLVLVLLGALLPDPLLSDSVIARAQLLPALLRWRSYLSGGAAAALFVLPLLLLSAYVFGRGYCSSLCPLGTLQDAVDALSSRISARRLRFRRPRTWLRLGWLVLVAGLWVGGVSLLLSLVEPYSVVQRAAVLIEGAVSGNPAPQPRLADAGPPPESALTTPPSGEAESARPPDRAVSRAAAAASASTLLSLLLLSAVLASASTKGRLFCNTLCPAGAILGLPGRFSLFRIRLSSARCTACGLCERTCRARCIDSGAKKLYAGSCVLCFNCIDACPHGAISYGVRVREG